jgi:hypothetical protein
MWAHFAPMANLMVLNLAEWLIHSPQAKQVLHVARRRAPEALGFAAPVLRTEMSPWLTGSFVPGR